MITILITGVGGPVGQAILKAARCSSVPCRVVGTDRSEYAVGFSWVEQPYILPCASLKEAYIAEMQRVCSAEGVKLVFAGSDSELELLAENAAELYATAGARVVVSPPELLRVALDKWQTTLFLQRSGLNFPRSVLVDGATKVRELVEEVGFPLIAKPRKGTGSRGLYKVRSWDDIRYLQTLSTEIVLQEYLQPDEEEYTVAAYMPANGASVGSIVFKRELAAGNTYRAWVSDNEEVRREAEAVVRALRPTGPCNVQLRLTSRGAVTFEINPRLSGTTAMRAHFGYNEVDMAIRELGLGEELSAPMVRPGVALRFWDERYLDGVQLEGTPGVRVSPVNQTLPS